MRTEPQWGSTGRQIYERTYRRTKADGEPENWEETVVRVVDGNLGLVDKRFHERDERRKLIDLFYDFKALPAGRHLWMSGISGRQFLFNCHRAAFDKDIATHFAFTFDQLMQGGGVGANYSNRYIKQYGSVKHGVEVHLVCDPDHEDYDEVRDYLSSYFSHQWNGSIRIEDSREGWINALARVLHAFWNGEERLVFDLSLIRHRGSRIRTFGGTAAGPAPLAIMLTHVSDLLTKRVGERLESLDFMLIDHYIATCVVSGNVRRSARMSIKNWADEDVFDFIQCKVDSEDHWSTNISVEIDDQFFRSLKKGDDHATAVYEAVVTGMFHNGEPGFYNLSLAQVGEVGDVGSTNPCGEITLEPWENCFDGSEQLLTREYGSTTFRDIAGETVTVMTDQGWQKADARQFGEQHVQRITLVPVRLQSGKWQRTRSNLINDVVVTPDHRWKLVDGTVTASLGVGEVIPVSAAESNAHSSDYRIGVQHGIIFGDGSADRQYANGDWRHRVRLFGANAEEMSLYFEHKTYPESTNGAPEGWLRHSQNLKSLPSGSEGTDYLAGFLYGWILADGSTRPNGSVHLASTHPSAEAWLRCHAASAGWVLRAARDSGVDETNFGSRKRPLWMFTLARPTSDNAWRVENIEPLPEKVPVYCVSVPGVENFTLADGILTMNCNLGHVNLDAFHNDYEGAAEAHRLMTRFLIRATFGDVPNDMQRAVVDRNRRIGVGHFGFQGWLVKQGIRFSDSYRHPYVRKTLKDFYNVVRKEARRYAFSLRIPEPIKVTTVAPTGTVAKLPGASEGIHPIYAKYFVRRVRYSSVDPGQIAALEQFAADGNAIADDIYTINTKVVEFITKDTLMQQVEELGLDVDYLVESADEIDLGDMLGVQAMYQDCYADNAISFTVNVRPDAYTTGEAMKTMIHYLPKLKGTTVMVDDSRPQAPYERITRTEYEQARFTSITDSIDEDCASGACPIR